MSRRRRESVRFAYGGGGGRVFVFSPPHLGLAYHISLPKHERERKEQKNVRKEEKLEKLSLGLSDNGHMDR